MRMSTGVRVLVLTVITLSTAAQAGTIYVCTAGNDANDGLSWGTPKRTVQAGLNAAVAGDQMWVAAGTYAGGISLKTGVALYGGFAGGETDLVQRDWTTNETILDGNHGGSVVHALWIDSHGIRIDGFTIRNGKSGDGNGGGIFFWGKSSSNSPLAIANNKIIDNSASSGGGVYCETANVVMSNNVIEGNTAFTGGGIYCAASVCMITNTTLKDNGGFWGGGVYCQSGGSTTVANSIIVGNGGYSGGGAYCNDAPLKVLNSTIAGNSANPGGALYCAYNTTIINTIIAFNSSGIYRTAGASVAIRRTCAYGNAAYNYSGLADPTGVDGNISLDPKLANLAYGNAHIQPGSPCIDAGDVSIVQTDWRDIDGESRIFGSAVDIGADESDGVGVWPSGPNVIVRVSYAGDDLNDGSSWEQAKRTVQAGIDATNAAGGDVWVQAGTYEERITLRNFSHVFGGFAGTETSRLTRNSLRRVTVLDGGQAGSVVTANYLGYAVSTLNGFTIRNGNGTNQDPYRYGGGIFCSCASPTIANNVISHNTGAHYGGGIWCGASSSPTILGNTISGNATIIGGVVECNRSLPTIEGTIIAFNSSGILNIPTGTLSLRYNCVYGNTAYNFSGLTDPTGTNGNISVDPLLVRVPSPGADKTWGTADDDYGDLHLMAGSPCINAGDPAYVLAAGETDMDGQPRKIRDRIDIGADEFCWMGDANFDGFVNVGDLQLLVRAWGTQQGDTNYNHAADCNGDGFVSVGDLQMLVSNWGKAL